MADRREDPCTLSTPADQIITTKLTLDWDVDFEKKTLSGSVKLDVKAVKDGVAKLVRNVAIGMIGKVPNSAYMTLIYCMLSMIMLCKLTQFSGILIPTE